MGKLTAARIRLITAAGRYSDGDGLLLDMNGKQSGRWLLRVQSGGKRRDIGFGSLKNVSLADARAAAFLTRQKIAQGIDPVAERKQERQTIPTFRDAAAAVHQEHRKAWKNGKHQKQWLATLETYAFPSLGNLAVDQIEGPAIREVLAPIWLSKPKPRGAFGSGSERCSTEPAPKVRATEAPMRSLSKGLPRQSKKDGHFAELPCGLVPAFLAKLNLDHQELPAGQDQWPRRSPKSMGPSFPRGHRSECHDARTG